ncbi:small cardioactive peptides-like precursor [Magallana gigas]|uniref:Small cardioactive peptide n=2 Tax=Magallana gigas TaxID=29159 RepID=Q5H7U9_MAGGI|nr:small cardioactive peptides-like precursor [Crassostrea gigas]BAD88767.1 small cardioactive peptide precursor [Crassostrea gigas]|eukprot:NP_001292304.1 small cardioactive peptides-like precursor [Crassostrea gigas]
MIVSGITSFMLLFVLLLQTDAKPTSALRQKRAPKYFYFPRMGRSAFYFPRMGRNQESADQEQSEEDIPCCNVGVSRAWGPEDPEPRRICPAAKCCGHLSSKVYVDSDLTVYEICVSDVAALPMEQKS